MPMAGCSEHQDGDAGRALQLAGDGVGALSGNQAHFLDGFAAFAEPLQLKGAGAAFADAWGIAMDAEEADRRGEGLNSAGHGAEVRGTPAVRHDRETLRQAHPAGMHGSILAERAGPWLDGVALALLCGLQCSKPTQLD